MKQINAAGKTYNLYWTYGTVEETGKNMETKVSGGGGGGASFRGTGGSAPVRITSRTIVHDQIFLIDEQGEEHSFQLQEMNVACRKSNKLSVIWAIKDGNKTGSYIAVYNHTTKESFFDKSALYQIFRRNGWLVLLAMIITSFVFGMLGYYIGYIIVIAIPIAWLVESSINTKKFMNNTDLTEFK